MSKWGFDRILRKLPQIERRFFTEAIKAAQKSEFKLNFSANKDNETNVSWNPVLRAVPPPILDVTGKLKAEAISKGKVVILPRKGILTIEPIDSRGRGYASYHQKGFTHKSGTFVEARPFISQSANLIRIQKAILLKIVSQTFK